MTLYTDLTQELTTTPLPMWASRLHTMIGQEIQGNHGIAIGKFMGREEMHGVVQGFLLSEEEGTR